MTSGTFAYCLLFCSLYAPAVSQTFQIVIPDNFTECTPAVIRWIGGAQPYELDLITGGHPGAVILQPFPQLQGTSFTWPANQRADGTFYTFRLFDATGSIAQSSQFRMQLGTDRSCLDVAQTTPGPTTEVASESATPQSTQPTAAPSSSPPSDAASTSVTTSTQSSIIPSPAMTRGGRGAVLSIGPIIGIVLGGIAFLVFMAVMLLWRRLIPCFVHRSTKDTPEQNRSSLTPAQPRASGKARIVNSPPMSFASSSTPTTNDRQVAWRAFPAQISGTPSLSDAPPVRPTSIEKSASGFVRATNPLSNAPSSSLSYSRGRMSDVEGADFGRQDGAATGFSSVDHARGVIRRGTPTHEADGGVRLAGGPPVPVDDDSAEDPSADQELPTLPPPYRVY